MSRYFKQHGVRYDESIVVERQSSYAPLRELNWRLVLGLFAVLFVCLFAYKYLDFVAHGDFVSPLRPLIEEGGGVAAALVLFPACYSIAIRFPLSSATWRRNVPIHLIFLCLFSFLLTSAMAISRNVLFPLAGLGKYDYGYMPVRYLMEFSNHFLVYWVGVALIYLFHQIRFAREREIDQAKLEANLAEARLQNLRLQLDPHFLFNTLNTISAVIYENPRAADEMIGRLSNLLRSLFEESHSQEVPLARELVLLDLYTRIMQARFEERLEISTDIDPSLHNALVPQFILQPLVENAIRHGADTDTFRVKILLKAKLVDSRICIIIRDHGPGLDHSIGESGIGVRNTMERLQNLYGSEQSFQLSNATEGGAMVELTIPFVRRELTEPALTPEPVWA